MLTHHGVPFLVWLDERALPELQRRLDGLAGYVRAWRELLGVS